MYRSRFFLLLALLNCCLATNVFPANITVQMAGFQFVPREITGDVGDTVTWFNVQFQQHDSVSGINGQPDGIWQSPLLNRNQTFSFTFENPGTFPYYCTPHWETFNMNGSVTIVAPNGPPTVSISSPSSGANFFAPATVDVTASASDSDGSVLQVEFLLDGDSFAVDSTSPYETTVSNLPRGNHTITAVAKDNSDATASASVSISVLDETDCAYLLSETTAAFGPAGGSGNVTVTTSSNCAWSIVNSNLWVQITSPTNGSRNGTIDFTVSTNGSLVRTGFLSIAGKEFVITQSASVTETNIVKAPTDFNGDNKTDFLWQNADGLLGVWLMDGKGLLSSQLLYGGKAVDKNWKIAATQDFNGDGSADILWQHSNGTVAFWIMSGVNLIRSELISGAPAQSPAWRIAGIADFNRDGKTDFLFRHSDGYLLVWFMNGTKFVSRSLLFNGDPVPTNWRIGGVNDFTGDGQADILWIDSSNSFVLWKMAGSIPVTGNFLNLLPRPNSTWQLVGAGDLNQDTRTDLIWRNSQGGLGIWFMSGTNFLSSTMVTDVKSVPGSWTLVAPK